jgi:hypothetical protein
LVLLAARPARANEPLQCENAQLGPKEGETIPANAPALPMKPTQTPVNQKLVPVTPSDVTLTTSDGTSLATTVTSDPGHAGGFLIVPAQPLPASASITGTFLESCDGTTKQQKFSTGAVSPMPATMGKLRVDARSTPTSTATRARLAMRAMRATARAAPSRGRSTDATPPRPPSSFLPRSSWRGEECAGGDRVHTVRYVGVVASG